jgi:hypothetical protein
MKLQYGLKDRASIIFQSLRYGKAELDKEEDEAEFQAHQDIACTETMRWILMAWRNVDP